MFETELATDLIPKVAPCYAECMFYINSLQFHEAKTVIDRFNNVISDACSDSSDVGDEVLNELYVLRAIPNILEYYSKYWESITESRLKESWQHLQDCISCLRLLKQFSPKESITIVDFFEGQLIELEKLYPYKMFASVGMLVDSFECSICGHDIDSLECDHVRGELYRGKMAVAVAKGIKQLNHVALVSNPADKRCVIDYDEDSNAFKAVKYLNSLTTDMKLLPADFDRVEIVPRLFPNEPYVKLSRNEICFCGSGKKFKKCCIDNKYHEGEHFEIIAKKTIHCLPPTETSTQSVLGSALSRMHENADGIFSQLGGAGRWVGLSQVVEK